MTLSLALSCEHASSAVPRRYRGFIPQHAMNSPTEMKRFREVALDTSNVYNLHEDGWIDKQFAVVGVDLKAMDDDAFRVHLRNGVDVLDAELRLDDHDRHQVAFRIERPGLAAGKILLLINAPDGSCRRRSDHFAVVRVRSVRRLHRQRHRG